MKFSNTVIKICRTIIPSVRPLHTILGIESSCDDTACAIVNSNRVILGECVNSQQKDVLRLGGIVPTIAQQWHFRSIETVVHNALNNAHLTVGDVDAIAVTVKPGLLLSLVVGLNHAKMLSKEFKKPLIPIHHMEAHALTVRLLNKEIEFPFLTLLISGGHCVLAIVKSVDEFTTLGKHIDDAPGEVLDKVARRLKLHNLPQYSNTCGGAAIEDIAKAGNVLAYDFSVPFRKVPHCNFSFAGLKSQAMRVIFKEEAKYGIEGDQILPTASDFCASFQYCLMVHIAERLQRAIKFIEIGNLLPTQSKRLVVSGGAASNLYLRRAFELICQAKDYELYVPPPKYCSDNGVMIAWNGIEKFEAESGIVNYIHVDDVRASDKVLLGEDISFKVWNSNIKCEWLKLDELEQDSFKGHDNSEDNIKIITEAKQ